MLHFTDAELQAKAVQLGLVQEGEQIPTAAMHSRVKAALVEERRTAPHQEQPQAVEPVCAKEIVVQPGGVILVDGEPFHWLVAAEPMQIQLDPEGFSTVRLALLTENVQILKPKPNSTSESE